MSQCVKLFFSFTLGWLGKLHHSYLFINLMLHFLVTSNYLSTAYCIDNDGTLGSLWRNSIWYFLLSYQYFCNSEENLRAALGKMGISNRAVEDVMDKVRNRHYQVGTAANKLLPGAFVLVLKSWLRLVNNLITYMQLACTLTFEAVHGTSCDAGINHPNQYFSDSQKVLQSKVVPLLWTLILCNCLGVNF